MNGTVIPQTPIAVDYWRIRQHPQTRLFFLTHMHGDHIQGLTASWHHPIYCSPVTKKLLIHRLQIRRHLIHELESGLTYTIPVSSDGSETIAVTALDANHCPGAVMFLFEGYMGRILYTGDFRYSEKMFTEDYIGDSPNPLLEQGKIIDILYLDNTYCNPHSCFPSRDEAFQQITAIIDDNQDCNILVGMRKLGKEELLVRLALHYQTWIVVTGEYYTSLQPLDLPNVFTTDGHMGFIHALPVAMINKKRLRERNLHTKTIAILPTALLGTQNSSASSLIKHVCYSDHSSYKELHQFVARVRPRKIRPVVTGTAQSIKGLVSREDMSCFDIYLQPGVRQSFCVPPVVHAYMQYGSVIQNSSGIHPSSAKRKWCNPQPPCRQIKRNPAQGVVYTEPDVALKKTQETRLVHKNVGETHKTSLVDKTWETGLVDKNVGQTYKTSLVDKTWETGLVDKNVGQTYKTSLVDKIWETRLVDKNVGQTHRTSLVDKTWETGLADKNIGQIHKTSLVDKIWETRLADQNIGQTHKTSLMDKTWETRLADKNIGQTHKTSLMDKTWETRLVDKHADMKLETNLVDSSEDKVGEPSLVDKNMYRIQESSIMEKNVDSPQDIIVKATDETCESLIKMEEDIPYDQVVKSSLGAADNDTGRSFVDSKILYDFDSLLDESDGWTVQPPVYLDPTTGQKCHIITPSHPDTLVRVKEEPGLSAISAETCLQSGYQAAIAGALVMEVSQGNVAAGDVGDESSVPVSVTLQTFKQNPGSSDVGHESTVPASVTLQTFKQNPGSSDVGHESTAPASVTLEAFPQDPGSSDVGHESTVPASVTLEAFTQDLGSSDVGHESTVPASVTLEAFTQDLGSSDVGHESTVPASVTLQAFTQDLGSSDVRDKFSEERNPVTTTSVMQTGSVQQAQWSTQLFSSIGNSQMFQVLKVEGAPHSQQSEDIMNNGQVLSTVNPDVMEQTCSASQMDCAPCGIQVDRVDDQVCLGGHQSSVQLPAELAGTSLHFSDVLASSAGSSAVKLQDSAMELASPVGDDAVRLEDPDHRRNMCTSLPRHSPLTPTLGEDMNAEPVSTVMLPSAARLPYGLSGAQDTAMESCGKERHPPCTVEHEDIRDKKVEQSQLIKLRLSKKWYNCTWSESADSAKQKKRKKSKWARIKNTLEVHTEESTAQEAGVSVALKVKTRRSSKEGPALMADILHAVGYTTNRYLNRKKSEIEGYRGAWGTCKEGFEVQHSGSQDALDRHACTQQSTSSDVNLRPPAEALLLKPKRIQDFHHCDAFVHGIEPKYNLLQHSVGRPPLQPDCDTPLQPSCCPQQQPDTDLPMQIVSDPPMPDCSINVRSGHGKNWQEKKFSPLKDSPRAPFMVKKILASDMHRKSIPLLIKKYPVRLVRTVHNPEHNLLPVTKIPGTSKEQSKSLQDNRNCVTLGSGMKDLPTISNNHIPLRKNSCRTPSSADTHSSSGAQHDDNLRVHHMSGVLTGGQCHTSSSVSGQCHTSSSVSGQCNRSSSVSRVSLSSVGMEHSRSSESVSSQHRD